LILSINTTQQKLLEELSQSKTFWAVY